MDNLSHRMSSLTPNILTANPENTVSIKVPRNSLQSAQDNGLAKTGFISRHLTFLPIRQRVFVEAAIQGTNDSIFFASEQPNADESQQRVTPTEFIKIRPRDHDDVVYMGDDFEMELIGMSVTPLDMFGGNDLLLCSLTRDDEAGGEPDSSMEGVSETDQTGSLVSNQTTALSTEEVSSLPGSSVDMEKSATKTANKKVVENGDQRMKDMPTSLRLTEHDQPFIHYDPILDGHDVGSKPNSFVPVPGSKRLYLQRKGKFAKKSGEEESPTLFVRFTVMEVDKLSEEQLSAIKSIEMIGASVGKAAASIPYLKVVSWMLKFASYMGKTALKKVSTPDHVMSVDIGIKIAQREEQAGENSASETSEFRPRQEEYGNYLRYGYYFFLSQKVDARLYAQTGSSTQSVALLLKRHGYNPKIAFGNEKEYFPLTGVSYVAVKVTRGCSPIRNDRKNMGEAHRQRLISLLEKYTTTEEKDAGKNMENDKKKNTLSTGF